MHHPVGVVNQRELFVQSHEEAGAAIQEHAFSRELRKEVFPDPTRKKPCPVFHTTLLSLALNSCFEVFISRAPLRPSRKRSSKTHTAGRRAPPATRPKEVLKHANQPMPEARSFTDKSIGARQFGQRLRH